LYIYHKKETLKYEAAHLPHISFEGSECVKLHLYMLCQSSLYSLDRRTTSHFTTSFPL